MMISEKDATRRALWWSAALVATTAGVFMLDGWLGLVFAFAWGVAVTRMWRWWGYRDALRDMRRQFEHAVTSAWVIHLGGVGPMVTPLPELTDEERRAFLDELRQWGQR